jgi:hypothetical protein
MGLFDSLERRSAPDQWGEIERRAQFSGDLAGPPPRQRGRVVALVAVVALIVAVAATVERRNDTTINAAGPTSTTTTVAPASPCQEQVLKPLTELGVTSTVDYVNATVRATLHNNSDNPFVVADSRTLVPLGTNGVVIGTGATTDVLLPSKELGPGDTLVLGESPKAQVATTDCMTDTAAPVRPSIADGVYQFVYLVSISGIAYSSEPILLEVVAGQVALADG